MKKPFIIVLLLALALCLCVSSVSAVAYCANISFSTLGQSGAEDILVYSVTDGWNQSLDGQYNTSSPYVPIPCGDTNIVVRPSSLGRVGNPVLMMTDAFGWVETYWLQLLILLFIAGGGITVLRSR